MGLQAPTTNEHRYQLCRDEYCDRFPCRVYREGFANGYEEGYAVGYGAGFSAGYSEGMAACPGPHGGE